MHSYLKPRDRAPSFAARLQNPTPPIGLQRCHVSRIPSSLREVEPAPERFVTPRPAPPRPQSLVGRHRMATRRDATKGVGTSTRPEVPGRGGITYIRRVAGGPGCCWALCSEGGSKPLAAAGGTPWAVSQGASAKEEAGAGGAKVAGREGLGGGRRRRGWGRK